MSIVDESARFTYSGIRPVPSPCGRYLAYLNGSKLAIRRTDVLTLDRLFKINTKSTNNFFRVTQVSWEPEYDGQSNKVAILIDNENTIKIYDVRNEDVDISITEDDVFGIEKFEWLPKGHKAEETAYDGSKLIVVFTRNELYARIYSLDYSQVLISVEKPKFNKILIKPNSDIFSIVTSKSNGYVVQNFVNTGSSVSHFNVIELDSFLNPTDSLEWSPNGQWLLCNDSVIGEMKISVCSLFNQALSQNGPLFSLRDNIDPLGAIDVLWGGGDDTVLVSDHHENIHCLTVSTGLSIDSTLQHRSQTGSARIWKQDGTGKYARKLENYRIPQINALPLHLKGINKFLLNGDYLFVTTKSMPQSVFIWDLSKGSKEPMEVLLSTSRTKDIVVSQNNGNLLLVVNEDSVSLWHTDWLSPLNVWQARDYESFLKGACLSNVTKGSARIMIWTSESFELVHVKLSSSTEFEGMDSKQTDMIRNGSPALVDDLTHVVELANGVQQSEWGRNNTNTIQLDDTFMNRRTNIRK